ncbi:hypothetical protein [Nostoc sp.]|uniref:hypothetical protein n=1 Tax=Nostoc sp. TaxID=1180 RepID=UPI002FF7A811
MTKKSFINAEAALSTETSFAPNLDSKDITSKFQKYSKEKKTLAQKIVAANADYVLSRDR